MPRYIDANMLLKKIYPLDLVDKRLYTINAKAVEDAIAKTPTADVVPKSEYIQQIAEVQGLRAELEEVKTEVAREIIQEVADFLWQGESERLNIAFEDHYYGKQEFIAELKKKYTEDK
jgi:hypothetical protein